jgi:CRISPR-associated protein Cas2
MSGRRRYLVTYDVSDAKRLRRTFRLMHGFGDPVQYSVFLCDLGREELQLLRERLSGVLNLREDRVLIVDLGPAARWRAEVLLVLGRQIESMPDAYAATIV